MRIRSFAGAFALVLSAATAATAAGPGGPSMPSGYIDVHGGVLSGSENDSIPTAASPFRRRRREERYAPPCPSPRTSRCRVTCGSTATISRAAPPVRRGPEELARTPRGTRRGATSWAYWFRSAATATGIAERSRTSESRRFTSRATGASTARSGGRRASAATRPVLPTATSTPAWRPIISSTRTCSSRPILAPTARATTPQGSTTRCPGAARSSSSPTDSGELLPRLPGLQLSRHGDRQQLPRRGCRAHLHGGPAHPLGQDSLQDLQSTVGLSDENPSFGDFVNR